MWVVEDAPEMIYCLAVSPRLIGNHALDLPQRKREKCVAAAVQSRSYRLGTDEFAESHHRRGVGSRPLRSWFEGWPNCEGLE